MVCPMGEAKNPQYPGDSQADRSGSANDRPAQKLDAEIAKIKKETTKLDEEIRAFRRQSTPLWRTLGLGRDLLGITVVGATLFYGVCNFVQQQEERNKFTVTKEVIDLVQQLRGDEQGQGNAAILLAAYEERALPVLLNTLTINDSSGLLRALDLISQKNPQTVISPLRDRAASEIDLVITGNMEAFRAFKNYVKALGTVRPRAQTDQTIILFRGFQNQLDCENLQEQGDFGLDVLDRRVICKEIKEACESISPGACNGE